MPFRRSLPLVTAVALALAGCGDGGSNGSAPSSRPEGSTTTTAPSSSTSGSVSASVPGGGDAADAGDYEGQQFDFGAITGVEEAADGTVWLDLNRQQLYQADGSLAAGPQLTEEPVLYGNTDVPYVDDSPKIRRFRVAPEAEVLRIEDPVPCASDEEVADPIWEPQTTADLVAGSWRDRLLDSLTFDAAGSVVRVRLSTGC